MRARYLYSFLLVAVIFFLQTGVVWPTTLVEDTREAMRLGKYDRALKLLEAALDQNPVDTNAHLLMTEYYLAIEDFRSAELSTERTLVLNRSYAPLVAQAYYVAGERATNRNQPAQALALYETAIALDPAFRSRVKGKYVAIANDLLAQRRLNAALSAYAQEVGLDPAAKKSVADAAFAHGQSLVGNNDQAAEKLFSYAVSLDSSYGPKAAKVKSDYGLDLLRRALEATGEERQRLKEQSLRYVPKEIADQAVPSPE